MPKLSFVSARALDSGLAALAALSAGFVAFAMPESLFSTLVETSRLPEFVPAAQPPLGETARSAATAAAALSTFVGVWGLMKLLGRRPAVRKPEAAAGANPGAEAPRIRRADSHPDAPARRPLLARDLGEPLDLDGFPEAPVDEAPPVADSGYRPLPAFLVPQGPESHAFAPGEPEPQGLEPEPAWSEAAPDRTEDEPEAEPGAGWRPEPQSAPLPVSELAARLPEAEEKSDQPLSQLVNRIEFGLARKRQALPAVDSLPAEEEEASDQEKVGHRLRSAINDLQKIASSGS